MPSPHTSFSQLLSALFSFCSPPLFALYFSCKVSLFHPAISSLLFFLCSLIVYNPIFPSLLALPHSIPFLSILQMFPSALLSIQAPSFHGSEPDLTKFMTLSHLDFFIPSLFLPNLPFGTCSSHHIPTLFYFPNVPFPFCIYAF